MGQHLQDFLVLLFLTFNIGMKCLICRQAPSAFKLSYGYGLWCLTPFSTIFQLYHGSKFYWLRKPEVLGENHRS
jgi:hypothetical protein